MVVGLPGSGAVRWSPRWRSVSPVIALRLRGCIPACAYPPSPPAAVPESPCLLPATEQAALLRAGTVSAVELLDAHLERIEALNPAVNAVVWKSPGHWSLILRLFYWMSLFPGSIRLW